MKTKKPSPEKQFQNTQTLISTQCTYGVFRTNKLANDWHMIASFSDALWCKEFADKIRKENSKNDFFEIEVMPVNLMVYTRHSVQIR